MSVYVFSTHPVWDMLYQWGLPHEIINIIFGFRTVFTPIGHPFKELEWSINESSVARAERTYIYSDVVNMFLRVFFVSCNSYSKKILIEFVKSNYRHYHRSKKELIGMFICYHSHCVDNAINFDHKIRIKCKSQITSSTIISDSLETNLKNLLSIKFNKEIYNMVHPRRSWQLSCHTSEAVHYTFIINGTYVWRMLIHIITTNEPKKFSRGELHLYNFMMGYPYKKSWNRQMLIRNLMVNEPYDNSEVYRIFKTQPSTYNMDTMLRMMEHINISTINYGNDKCIDYEKTLERYFTIYEGNGCDFNKL